MSRLVAEREEIQNAVELAKSAGVKIVDLRFTDLLGTWQHFSIPVGDLKRDLFDEGIGFDGSSIRGFQPINLSDMMLYPDPTTAIVDPVLNVPTLSMICDVVDPTTGDAYSRDPRNVAQKAETYLLGTGIADMSYWGPECEFFIFSRAQFHQDANSAGFRIDSPEGIWNSGASEVDGRPNLGYRPGYKQGYFPVPPVDSLQDVRSEMVLKLIEAGIGVEVHHHEVGTAGQAEISMRRTTLTKMADSVMAYKYITKNVAVAHGLTVTFMPKPIYGDNGSGMHVHQSLWKDGVPLFFSESGYALYERNVPSLHRRAAGSRARLAGILRSDNEFLPQTGTRLRGARIPGLFGPQSQRRMPNPCLQRNTGPETDRIPLPGSERQSISGLRGDADGGIGRDSQ